METIVNDNSGVYYQGKYWNDLPAVHEYICKNFTGDKKKYWMQDFKERFAKKPFKHALFLNCGSGWVEREFIDNNIVTRATAFDYSNELLVEANKQKGKRKIKYFQADVNKVEFKDNEFDLIVNVAALHHVQFINRLSYFLARSLKEGGLFVNFDYIGPSRNQYSLKQWYYIRKVNNLLPKFIRQSLIYPHLPTMLKTDPTEAIHSDLIINTVSHFFDIFERHDTGGGIAYILLTHNKQLEKLSPAKFNHYINMLLKYDDQYTKEKKVPPMFSYFITRVNKSSLLDREKVKYLQGLENKREKRATKMKGIYSKTDYTKMKFFQIKHKMKFLKSLIKAVAFK